MIKVLTFSNDPGGSNAIISVANALVNNTDFVVKNYVNKNGVNIWRNSNVDFEFLDDWSHSRISETFSQFKPDFILCGTSENCKLEKNIWQMAKKNDLVSAAIIDHWRFQKEHFLYEGSLFSPDYIFAIDEETKTELLGLGIKPKSIIITGQPYFETISSFKDNMSFYEFCLCNNFHTERKIITFASDTVEKSCPGLGYNEKTILELFLSNLSSIKKDILNQYQLIIKLHPKEDGNELEQIISDEYKSILPVTIIKNVDSKKLVYHSDIVVGMFTMLLLESYLMNKKTLSIQVGGDSVLSLGPHNLQTVTKRKELLPKLKKLFTSNNTGNLLSYRGTINNITRTILELQKTAPLV